QHLYFRFAQIIGIQDALFGAGIVIILKLAPSIPAKRKLLLCAQTSFTIQYECVFRPLWFFPHMLALLPRAGPLLFLTEHDSVRTNVNFLRLIHCRIGLS